MLFAFRLATARPEEARIDIGRLTRVIAAGLLAAACHGRPPPDGAFADDAEFERARIPLDRGRPGAGAPLFDRITMSI